MVGCGKHFVEPFDYTCGVKEVNGTPLCQECKILDAEVLEDEA